jgi:hypothetical protein
MNGSYCMYACMYVYMHPRYHHYQYVHVCTYVFVLLEGCILPSDPLPYIPYHGTQRITKALTYSHQQVSTRYSPISPSPKTTCYSTAHVYKRRRQTDVIVTSFCRDYVHVTPRLPRTNVNKPYQ